MIGGTRFYDRKEVRDLLAYLRLLLNPKDDASLRRVLNVPARDIGKTTLEVVQETARRERLPLLEAVEKLAAEGPGAVTADAGRSLTTRAQKALAGFADLLRELREAARDLPPSRLVARIVSRTRFEEHLAATSPGDAAARIENLQELANAVAAYDGMEGGLTAFLDRTALLAETDNTQGSSGVRMLTLHSAKGLEFDTVFIVGVEEDLCPHLRAAENEADLEEERRLLYVGMTRARKRLLLSRADTRFQFGQARSTTPSRFLQEVPATLLRVQSAEAVERWARGPRPVRRFERSPVPAPRSGGFWTPDPDVGGDTATPPSVFSLGCKVHHAEYGVGTVIGIEGTGDQQKVTVSFSIVGSKKFLPRFARLERL
ncbi:MAG TPA: 3'-5' exonuclease, partial [Candidatus Polarisedimenticolia bacterium]|nr:3'-5' exonuclease [Candidatus Polarisedimenticolia bacterium]